MPVSVFIFFLPFLSSGYSLMTIDRLSLTLYNWQQGAGARQTKAEEQLNSREKEKRLTGGII